MSVQVRSPSASNSISSMGIRRRHGFPSPAPLRWRPAARAPRSSSRCLYFSRLRINQSPHEPHALWPRAQDLGDLRVQLAQRPPPIADDAVAGVFCGVQERQQPIPRPHPRLPRYDHHALSSSAVHDRLVPLAGLRPLAPPAGTGRTAALRRPNLPPPPSPPAPLAR